MGCKIWTPFWGPPNCFFLSRPPKWGPDFRPHFEVHIALFFSQRDAEKGHPRAEVRFLHTTLLELGRTVLRALVFGTLFSPHFGAPR